MYVVLNFLVRDKVLCKFKIFTLNHYCTFDYLTLYGQVFPFGQKVLLKCNVHHFLFLVATFTLNKYLRILLWLNSVYYVNWFFVVFSSDYIPLKKTVSLEAGKAFFVYVYCCVSFGTFATSGAGKGLISSMGNFVCIWVSRLEK